MRQGHPALLMIDLDRLAVAAVCPAGRAVTRMRNGHVALREGRQVLFGKYVVD